MKGKNKILLISTIAVVAVIAIFFACAANTVSTFKNSDKILANTFFYDVDLGGKTIEEGISAIKEKEDLFISKPITVAYNDKQFTFTPEGAGIEYDLESIMKSAYERGRSNSFFGSFSAITGKNKAKKIDPVYKDDKKVFEDTLKTLSEHSGIVFVDYSITEYETFAEIKIGDGNMKIDYEKLMADTYAIIEKEERTLELPVVPAETISADDIYNELYREAQDAKIVTENGKTKFVQHVVGVFPNKGEIESGLASGKAKFRVTIEKKYPEKRSDNIGTHMFTDVLGRYQTNYNKNVIGRSKNVALAASKINGTVLNPEDVFSYNGVVGPRTAAAGFSNATVYTSNGMEDGIGGGICQVSSTLYNAVLYSDLKIVERRNHSYTVSYVKKGLDATVSYGAIDFKFSNNKANPVKIKASAADGVLVVEILGKKENDHTIELGSTVLETYGFQTQEKPNANLAAGERKIVQNGSNGCKVSAYKIVKDSAGNVVRKDSLGVSVYKAMTCIVEVGPGGATTPETATEASTEVAPVVVPEGENPALNMTEFFTGTPEQAPEVSVPSEPTEPAVVEPAPQPEAEPVAAEPTPQPEASTEAEPVVAEPTPQPEATGDTVVYEAAETDEL